MSTQPQSRDALRTELGAGSPPEKAPPPKVEHVVAAKPKLVQLKHHDTCPGIRGRECTCEANLVWLAESGVKPLERMTQEWEEVEVVSGVRQTVKRKVELWRVDAGRDHETTVPGKSVTMKSISKTIRLPPRWVCTACGWAGRGSDVSHRCDKAAVARATRVASVSSALTIEQRFSGAYRLVIWQDADLVYHLAEEYTVGGKVEALVEIDTDGNYSVIEGALLSAVVDRFAP